MEGLKDWLQPEIIWFMIGLVLLVLEFSAPGLIIAFFGIGAWVVALVALFFDVSLTTQLLIFLITSIFMLVFLRKSLRKVFKLDSFESQNELEDFLGHTAEVTVKILPGKPGKVELNGTSWEAESDAEIAKGKTVRIVGRKSITFKVEPI
jgi:inner membrane protein